MAKSSGSPRRTEPAAPAVPDLPMPTGPELEALRALWAQPPDALPLKLADRHEDQSPAADHAQIGQHMPIKVIHAHAESVGHLPLRRCGVLLEILEEAVAGLVSRVVTHG